MSKRSNGSINSVRFIDRDIFLSWWNTSVYITMQTTTVICLSRNGMIERNRKKRLASFETNRRHLEAWSTPGHEAHWSQQFLPSKHSLLLFSFFSLLLNNRLYRWLYLLSMSGSCITNMRKADSNLTLWFVWLFTTFLTEARVFSLRT